MRNLPKQFPIIKLSSIPLKSLRIIPKNQIKSLYPYTYNTKNSSQNTSKRPGPRPLGPPWDPLRGSAFCIQVLPSTLLPADLSACICSYRLVSIYWLYRSSVCCWSVSYQFIVDLLLRLVLSACIGLCL